MELFTFIPYFLLLEREESDRNTLANANTEFIREVYELQRVEKDVTLVFFQLQYLSCKLVILREHYRTAQKEHLPDRKSTRLNSSHKHRSRMPSSA